MFQFGTTEREGWFFTPTFGAYQKVNQDVYVYVIHHIGFYVLQLYQRGTTYMCTLEARSKGNPEALFELGETWLQKYQVWDNSLLEQDVHSITQPEWRDNCWIS